MHNIVHCVELRAPEVGGRMYVPMMKGAAVQPPLLHSAAVVGGGGASPSLGAE